MGPQLKGCGRLIALALFQIGGIELQWGRSLRAAEGGMAQAAVPADAPLQWGRSLRAAEGEVADAAARAVRLLQWGRSLRAAEGSVTKCAADHGACFNGAAA